MDLDFKNEILQLEQENTDDIYILQIGKIPVIITAVHTMIQYKSDDFKSSEPFTKAIAKYVSNKVKGSYFIKLKDTGIDSNSLRNEEFKEKLLNIIKDNNIKLLLDLHGAKKERKFDVELGTLNNLSADFTTIKELADAFNENKIYNIEFNTPFKGGGITQYIYDHTDIDVIQIEINAKYRDINNIDDMQKICNAIIEFLQMYTNFN